MEAEPRDLTAFAAQRPGRRGAAVAALAVLPLLAALVLFVLLRHLGLVAVLGAAFALFFSGGWAALSRRGWRRGLGLAVAALGGLGVLGVAVGIGWISTGATVAIFVLSGCFVGLTRYALGDRVEDEP